MIHSKFDSSANLPSWAIEQVMDAEGPIHPTARSPTLSAAPAIMRLSFYLNDISQDEEAGLS